MPAQTYLMSVLDINIKATTEAAQAIEKQLAESILPAKQIIVLSKQLVENINATNILFQIKAAQKSDIIPVENKIIKM